MILGIPLIPVLKDISFLHTKWTCATRMAISVTLWTTWWVSQTLSKPNPVLSDTCRTLRKKRRSFPSMYLSQRQTSLCQTCFQKSHFTLPREWGITTCSFKVSPGRSRRTASTSQLVAFRMLQFSIVNSLGYWDTSNNKEEEKHTIMEFWWNNNFSSWREIGNKWLTNLKSNYRHLSPSKEIKFIKNHQLNHMENL